VRLESIASYLQAQSVGTQGQDIFINAMPALDEAGILLRQPFSGTAIDHELPRYRKTSFMLITRARTMQAAKILMDAAVATLTVSNSDALTDLHVNYIRPRHEPIAFAPTPGNMTELLVNMDACYVDLG